MASDFRITDQKEYKGFSQLIITKHYHIHNYYTNRYKINSHLDYSLQSFNHSLQIYLIQSFKFFKLLCSMRIIYLSIC